MPTKSALTSSIASTNIVDFAPVTYETATFTETNVRDVNSNPIGGLPKYGIYLEGTDSNDTLNGTIRNDELHGHDGNDYLYGGSGDDQLFGDNGNDYLVGGTGNDRVDGGAGNDYIMAGDGNDTFIGGTGSDTLDFSTMTTNTGGITVDLTSGFNTTGDTISGIENLVGTAGSDILNGNADANTLTGGDGTDWLFGQGGNDIINGGNGDDNIMGGDGVDYLAGGAGNDRLTGGQGADFFVMGPNTGVDAITDFQTGIDKIILSGFGANPLGNDGKIAYGAFSYELFGGTVETKFSNLDSSDKLLYDYHTQTLYKIDPSFINGHVANYHAEAIAHIDYDATSHFAIGSSDFIFA